MENLIATVGSFILGIAVVSAFIAKYAPKVIKYITVAKEVADLADKMARALQDGNLTEDEVKGLVKEYADIKEALQALKA